MTLELKYITGNVKASSDTGTISAIITKLRVDRDNERVIPSGMRNYAEYMDNPLIYWAHEWSVNMAAEPIGRADTLNLRANYIDSTGVFAPTQKAQNIRALVIAKIVSKTSIGFNVIHEGESKDIRGVNDIDLWELMEWSIVPMPSNVEASITGVKSALHWWETWMPMDQVNARSIISAADDAHLSIGVTKSGIALLDGTRAILQASPTVRPTPVIPEERRSFAGATRKDAADDVSMGAHILACLAELKDEESDDPEDAAILQRAIDAVLEWMGTEYAEIGSPEDQAESIMDEQEAMGAEADRAPMMMADRPKRTLTYRRTA